MSKYSLYKHTSPSGRVYIGISTNPQKRWNRGNGYRYNPYFWRCIQKYGWDNIRHEIIACDLTEAEAKAKEVELIAEYKSNLREFGYNISGGGDGCVAEETRKKQSEARKGNNNCVGRILSEGTKQQIAISLREYYSHHPQPFKGRHHTNEAISKLKARVVKEETKQKMRANHADVKGDNNPSARRICCYSLESKYIKTYPYASLAAQELHIDLSSLIKCCRGKIKSAGGFIWKYEA